MQNYCKGCAHNNEEKANQMFYKQYCELFECQMSGSKCKYRKPIDSEDRAYSFLLVVVLRIYWRFNAILGWIALLPIDWMISLTTEESFKSAHKRSNEAVKASWNKY